MKVILDTSFIVSCIRSRIDFISQLEEQGFSILIPREVMQELKDLKFKTSQEDRVHVGVALEMIEKKKIKKMRLGTKSVDQGLMDKGNEGYYIATLDKEIKNKVAKRVVIFSAKGQVGVE